MWSLWDISTGVYLLRFLLLSILFPSPMVWAGPEDLQDLSVSSEQLLFDFEDGTQAQIQTSIDVHAVDDPAAIESVRSEIASLSPEVQLTFFGLFGMDVSTGSHEASEQVLKDLAGPSGETVRSHFLPPAVKKMVLRTLLSNPVLAVIRTTINGSVATLGVMIADQVSLAEALPVGLAAGIISGVYHFSNPLYMKWVTHKGAFYKRVTKPLMDRVMPSVNLALSISEKGNVFSKWAILEIVYVGLVNAVRLHVGLGAEVDSAIAEALNTASAVGLAVLAQAPWEDYIFKKRVSNLLKAQSEEEVLVAKMKSNVGIFAASCASVGSVVFQLMGLYEVSNAIFGTMIVSGNALYIYEAKKERIDFILRAGMDKMHRFIEGARVLACRKVF